MAIWRKSVCKLEGVSSWHGNNDWWALMGNNGQMDWTVWYTITAKVLNDYVWMCELADRLSPKYEMNPYVGCFSSCKNILECKKIKFQKKEWKKIYLCCIEAFKDIFEGDFPTDQQMTLDNFKWTLRIISD